MLELIILGLGIEQDELKLTFVQTISYFFQSRK